MSKFLVIVESPAKAKTIKNYLGKDYEVLASYGHIRDLPPKTGSVDPDHSFSMKYALIEKNKRHVDSIANALKKAEEGLLLATDPDREGEAISWHIHEVMKERRLLKDKSVSRIVFNEITKPAIQEAILHPRDISQSLVDAYRARRAMDYLVGFYLSPLLWTKIRRGLSAGRVQSPALRLIVEREIEIENFVSREYWRILANLKADNETFTARLTHYNGKKLDQFDIENGEQAETIVEELLKFADSFQVVKVEKKQRKRKPSAPFTTSTLQQEAVRKLGFSAKKTMMIAQQLYEGIDVGGGTVGLITYMRTDSVHLSKEAVEELRRVIVERYGEESCPKDERFYRTKSKNAQEAHEAIRPTSIRRFPEELQSSLTSDQLKLYTLIWKRTIASQMEDALLDTVQVDLRGNEDHLFRANGSCLVFSGFLAVYEEGLDDPSRDDSEGLLPPLKEGQALDVLKIDPHQHFTEPPPRYSEASLVKTLEEHDIGRPSTYASIIHTLLQREYVILEKKRFKPTDIGRIVNRFLTGYFTRYVDYQFTASLEDELDAISRGEKDWVNVLSEFWNPFISQIHETDESVERRDVTTELLDEKCPKCGKQLSIRLGKRGRFIGCTGYPDCDYTENLATSEEGPREAPEVIQDRVCPQCSSPLHIKTGKYGKFIGCSSYPSCRFIEAIEKPADTGVDCPKCGKAKILKRKSRKGKIFYSCGAYPKCDYALWNEPIAQSCPQCDFPILTVKETRSKGRQILCPKEGCGYISDDE